MLIASATQMKNRFGRYLRHVQEYGEVYIEKHGRLVAKLITIEHSQSCIGDEIRGIKEKKLK